MPSVSTTKSAAGKAAKVTKVVAKGKAVQAAKATKVTKVVAKGKAVQAAKATKETNGASHAKANGATMAPDIRRRKRVAHSELRGTLGGNLVRLREKAKMTKGMLSKQTGVSAPYLDLIERGDTNTGLDIIHVLATNLGTTAAALISPPRAKTR